MSLFILFFVRYLLFFILLILLGVLYYFSNERFNTQKVTLDKSIFTVSKSNFLDTLRIKNKLKYFLKDTSTCLTFLKNESTIEKAILKNPAVRSADVSFSLGNVVRVKVVSKKVVARVRAKNVDYYLDDMYQPMKLSPFYTEKVLLVTDTIAKKEKKQVYALIGQIIKQPVLKENIVEINKMGSDYALINRSPKLKIILGDLSDMKRKLEKLLLFYRWAISRKMLDGYQQINLKYINQVVCSKRQ